MENDITDIGKVAITPQKDYKENATYEWLDVVTYDGASYMCISEDGCTGITPTNTEYWQLLADKGRFTEEDKETFKQAVVEESKTTINEHTETKKTDLNNYTTNLETSLKNELDTYEEGKEEELDIHKTTLETEMTNTKDTLVQEIKTAKNGFDENVIAQTTAFNNNATEKTNTFNSNVETKTNDFNTNATAKIEEYNSNATAKVAEFNENAQSYATELEELAQQMIWNTTEISKSIHIEDSAKYSRNKLDVFGNLKQDTREGYNLLDISVIKTQTSNGVTITNNGDGTLTFNGTATKSFGINTEITQKTIPAGNYTKYIIKDTNIGTGLTVSLGKTTSGSISGTVLQPKNGISSLELTEDLTYNQLRLYINSGAVFNKYVLKWMIVEGTYTENTIPAYEQYGAMPSIDYPSMPVIATGVQKIRRCGKNLLATRNITTTKNGLTFTVNEDGTITVNGTATAQTLFPINSISSGTQKIEKILKNTYTLSAGTDCSSEKYFIQGSYVENNTTRYTNTTLNNSITLTIKENTLFGAGIIVRAGVTCNNVVFKPQLEIGNTATDYEPYKEEVFELDLADTELCKITDSDGNVVAQDRAVYREVDGVWKWQWKKYILKAVINSKSEFTYNGLKNNNTVVDFLSPVLKNLPTNIYSPDIEKITRYNYLKPNSTSSVNKFRISVSLADLGLEEFTTQAVAIQALKDLITKKGDAIIYYKATEPIYEDCKAEQSAVLDKLYKLQLEKGVNNIFVESENGVTAELQLEYMQDRIMLEEAKDKEFDDRITALEAMILSNASEEV